MIVVGKSILAPELNGSRFSLKTADTGTSNWEVPLKRTSGLEISVVGNPTVSVHDFLIGVDNPTRTRDD